MEYPAHGLGDYRESCINIRTEKGNVGLALSYVSHKITEGKDGLEGLPASFGKAGECEINEHYLDIKLSPKVKSRSYELEVTYTVADSTRKTRIEVEVI